ncbi:hypothetical protein ACJJIW_16685 [Microbulbifer sp. JMSA004]|uniref:hypothetical protein n=1 Tax=Microbulbifer sp. JMSA004 TaxID=3243370 RepID=UPI00403A0C1D
MINIAEDLLAFLEFVLFIIAAYCFVASFVYDRKVRGHISSKANLLVKFFVPSIFISNSFLDEQGVKYKKQSIVLIIYTALSLLLAVGLLYSGIEILKTLETTS